MAKEEQKRSVKPTVAFVWDDYTHEKDPRMTKAIDQFMRILEMESSTLQQVNTRLVPLSKYFNLHFSERNSARLFVGFFPADTPRNVSVKIPLTEEDEKNIVDILQRDASYTHPSAVKKLTEEFAGKRSDASYEAKLRQMIGFDYMEGWHMGERLLRVAAPALHVPGRIFHKDLRAIRSKNQGTGNSSSRLILIGLMFDDAADRYHQIVTRHCVRPNLGNLRPVEAMWVMWNRISLVSPKYWCPDRIIMYDTRDFPRRLEMPPDVGPFERLLGTTLSLILTVSKNGPFATLEAIVTLGLFEPSKFPLVSHRLEDPRLLLLVAAMCDTPTKTSSEMDTFIEYERGTADDLVHDAGVCEVAVGVDRLRPDGITDEHLRYIRFWSKTYKLWNVHGLS